VYLFKGYLKRTWLWAAIATLISANVFAAPPSLLGDSLSSQKLDEFMQEQVQTKMKEHKVAGTTIALVQNGELIYSKGFGYSDINLKKLVNAQQTLFRWGSVSKTVTWTAIMQLVEQGKISLDADVNDYLINVKVPDTYAEPIRVRDLLAHTAGFEDLIIGHIFEKDASQVLLLTDYLNKYKPERVRPPGELFSYSNYSTGLAGQIIANVSQMSFEDYVEKHIFNPLDMKKATFREPLPANFEERMKPELSAFVSKSFTPQDVGFKQIEHFTYLSSIGPAGAMSATAVDMAKFAYAHLNGCKNLLLPETCTEMRKAQLSITSAGDLTVNHGFFQHRKFGGHKRFGHKGGTDYFHSEMGIYPDLEFAIVISSNTSTGKAFNKEIEEAIVKQLFGSIELPPLELPKNQPMSQDLSGYIGTYVDTRRPQSNIEILYALSLPSTKVSLGDNGQLIVESGGKSFHASKVSGHLFVDIEADRHFEFIEDQNGNISHMKSLLTYDRVESYKAPENRVLFLLVCIMLIVVMLVANLIFSLKRFALHQPVAQKKARQHVVYITGAWIAFVVFLLISIVHDLGEYTYPYDFPSTWVISALAFGVLATLLSILPIYSMFKLWRDNQIRLFHKIVYAIQVIVILLFIAQLHTIHLIGFNYF